MTFGEPRFLRFQVVFWLVAGIALLFSGLSQMQPDAALVRNIYLTIAGFLSTFFLAFIYERLFIGRFRAMLLPAIVVSVITGFLCTLSVNPITFLQLGDDRQSLTVAYIFSGAFNFSLLMLVWSLIYLLRIDAPLFGAPEKETFVTTLAVDDQRGRRILDVSGIVCIKAAGDYVEILHAGSRHMRRGYISDLEKQLDPSLFLRIHRSVMINRSFVRNIVRRPKAEFEIDLGDDVTVSSGRSYEKAITGAFSLDQGA